MRFAGIRKREAPRAEDNMAEDAEETRSGFTQLISILDEHEATYLTQIATMERDGVLFWSLQSGSKRKKKMRELYFDSAESTRLH